MVDGCTRGSSPHTRGARLRAGQRARARRIIPAYAGSTGSHTAVRLERADHPRIRGEHRSASAEEWSTSGSSPHTRGALTRRQLRTQIPGIIPAYAGSTRPGAWARRASRDHPRIRGEHLQREAHATASVGSSPHTRGARDGFFVAEIRSRIIPAYAGSTPSRPPTRPATSDHPRIRGEHSSRKSRPSGARGSSPHTRGAPVGVSRGTARAGIIPAYAGSTAVAIRLAPPAPDHPRIRGEHSARPLVPYNENGSSPHTRGALSRPWRTPASKWIIPAYAGSTCPRCGQPMCFGDHPRIRGEHMTMSVRSSWAVGSSPHTRGAPGMPLPTVAAGGIIPAYAGSTRCRTRRRGRCRDHPRIRGEH